MSGDLRDQLVAIFGKPEAEDSPAKEGIPGRNIIACPHQGAKVPEYFGESITKAFARYVVECARQDFEDPRQICVTLLEENFPKLIKLMYRPRPNAPGQRARAKAVIPALREGVFDESKHYSEQPIRLETLFWISDVIRHPDGIHPNCAKLVEGEEVYFKRYDKAGSEIKLVFTTIRQGGLRVVVTSFLDSANSLHKYCALPALWPQK